MSRQTPIESQGIIRLHRFGQLMLSGRAFQVYADGILLGRIRNGKTEDYRLSSGQHTLKIKIDFLGSRELPVHLEADQVLSLRCGQNLRQILNLNFFNDQYLCLELDTPDVPSAISTGFESWLIQIGGIGGLSAYVLLLIYQPGLFWPITGSLIVVGVLMFALRWRGCTIATDGMTPTLQKGDRLLVRRTQQAPQRGDMMQFQVTIEGRPGLLISRVVGLPGDVLQVQEGRVVLNGEQWDADPIPDRQNLSIPSTPIPNHEYFVLADNPNSRFDSRSLGSIKAKQIRGIVRGIVFPFRRCKPL